MDENKKIGYQEIAGIANDYYEKKDVIDFHGVKITVLRRIPYTKLCSLVDAVVKSCFDAESGEYIPEVRDFATRLAVASAYTNLELPDNLEEQYDMMYATDLMDQVHAAIDHNQLSTLRGSIQKRCEIINDMNRAAIEKEIYDAVGIIGNIADSFEQMFDGVSREDMKMMIQAIGDHGLNEGKLAEAVVREQNAIREKKEGKVVPFPAAEINDGE